MANPSIKRLRSGLTYVEFCAAYQLLLGNFYPDKHFFQARYGAYCNYQRTLATPVY